jgi:hypothetical protein
MNVKGERMMFRGKVWNAESVLDVHTSSAAWPGDKKSGDMIREQPNNVPFTSFPSDTR